jgi:hypothetical protein
MNSLDGRLARILMERNLEEARRLANSRYLVHSMNRARLGWRRLPVRLGTWLLALGEWLVQGAPVRPAL